MSREGSWLQSMTSEVFMTSREAILRPVILRLTLESPIMEKSLEIDIAKLSCFAIDEVVQNGYRNKEIISS